MSSSPPPTAEEVRLLSSGRWLIPILAHMSREGGGRFGALVRRLDISRSVLSSHIDTLEKLGWLSRNPGHGHPLRPEYRLSSRGAALARWSMQVLEQGERVGVNPRLLGRWSLPLMFELKPAPKSFSILERALVPVTPRALSLALQQLQEVRLLERQRQLYGLSERGQEFAAPLVVAPSKGARPFSLPEGPC